MGFAATIASFIEQHELLSLHGSPCLVGLSGGADSIALTLVLLELGYRVEAVHCNFLLRGDESLRDEQFVADFCHAHNLPLHRAHFDTQGYARLHHESIEMAARHLRYTYFEQLRRDLDAQAVCVAHHQDDSAETLLLNLLRGTGLHGLVGIRPRNGHIVRPLLCTTRQQIEAFLAKRQQPFVTDSTNLEPCVLRNKVRLELLPTLRQLNPAIDHTLATTAQQLLEAEHIYNHYTATTLSRLIGSTPAPSGFSALPIGDLLATASPAAVLFEWLHPHGFTPAVIRQIAAALPHPTTGRTWASATHEVGIDRNRLLLGRHCASPAPMVIPETGTYRYQDRLRFSFAVNNEVSIRRSPDCACLDADKLQFPLTIRPAANGDRFVPLGMKGSRLLSDFLTDLKQPLFLRRQQLVVADAQGNIVWVVGLRPDQRFAIGPDTASMLTIETVQDGPEQGLVEGTQ